MSLDVQEPPESGAPAGGWSPCIFLAREGCIPRLSLSLPRVYLLESLSRRMAGWWWLLFHLGFRVGGGDIASGEPSLHSQGRSHCWYKSGGTVMHCLWCCGTGVGERKGDLNWWRDKAQWFPHVRLLLSLDSGNSGPVGLWEGGSASRREDWLWGGQGSLVWRLWWALWVLGSFSCLLSPFSCPSFGLA